MSKLAMFDCAAGPPELPTDDLAMPPGLIEPFALQNLFLDGMVIQPGVNGDVLHFLGMPSIRASARATRSTGRCRFASS